MSKSPISLEFFPPRDIAAQERLIRSTKQLLGLQPEYVSVTFGAGGSTRSGTIETVSMLHNLGFDAAPHLSCVGSKPRLCSMHNLGFDAAPHLSCVGSSLDFLRETLDTYRNMGIRRV